MSIQNTIAYTVTVRNSDGSTSPANVATCLTKNLDGTTADTGPTDATGAYTTAQLSALASYNYTVSLSGYTAISGSLFLPTLPSPYGLAVVLESNVAPAPSVPSISSGSASPTLNQPMLQLPVLLLDGRYQNGDGYVGPAVRCSGMSMTIRDGSNAVVTQATADSMGMATLLLPQGNFSIAFTDTRPGGFSASGTISGKVTASGLALPVFLLVGPGNTKTTPIRPLEGQGPVFSDPAKFAGQVVGINIVISAIIGTPQWPPFQPPPYPGANSDLRLNPAIRVDH